MRRCKTCHNSIQKSFRNTNRETYNAQGRNKRRAMKERAVEYKGGKCLDCKGVFPACVYDFHHLDPSEKEFTPGNTFGRKWENIVSELDKCILLCANCHRLRHNETTIG